MTRLILPDQGFDSDEIVLEGEEFHYLSHVRRHKKGDLVEVYGAAGRRFSCAVTALETHRAVLRVGQELAHVRMSWPVTIVVAAPKRNLMDDVVRKVSEIGICRLIPILSARSVAQPGPSRAPRWRKIALESLRQCGRETPLIVDDVRPIGDVFAELAGEGTGFILHPRARGQSLAVALSTGGFSLPLSVVVGPEGGFSDSEIAEATGLGFGQVSLGPRVLKVETAAIVASVLCISQLNGFDPVDNVD